MKFVKIIMKNIVQIHWVGRHLIKLLLHLHNYFYSAISYLSQFLEKNKLHPKHRIIKYHQWFSNKVKKNWIILDIGCSIGALSYFLSKNSRKVIGIDFNKDSIEIAKKKYNKFNIEFIFGDVTTYNFKKFKKIDCVVISNVLEHIKKREQFLNKIKDISNLILIRIPMFNRDWITAYKKEMGIEWRLDKTHFVEYTFENFKNELKNVGLTIKEYKIEWGEIYAVVKREK